MARYRIELVTLDTERKAIREDRGTYTRKDAAERGALKVARDWAESHGMTHVQGDASFWAIADASSVVHANVFVK